MKRESITRYSNELGQDMELLVFGDRGYPIAVFPTQNAMASNWEDFGMIQALADYIDNGRIQLFCVDSVDAQSWTDEAGDKEWRADRQEAYFSYVCHELVPLIHETNGSELRPLAAGCGLGATHAAIAVLRRPDLFQGCIALSGIYRTSSFFGDWMNGTLYENDIPVFLGNMPGDHYYVDLYNKRQIVMCVGQGAWERGIDDLRSIAASFDRLGVQAWCDFWGPDVTHDWSWWKRQMPYFMAEVLADIERENVAQSPIADKGEQAETAPQPDKGEPVVATPVPKKPGAKEKKPASRKSGAKAKAPAQKQKAVDKTEELNSLTVAVLRKRARELGVKSNGLRKAELVKAIAAASK